ncbi:biopolymer transporter ExbD [Aquisalimonas sp.]|uniref:ExbD/TolR family protein n=1 Tax=Aquisalimonas sp. TaxID=1872621 RepID=UPI0025C25FC7|nr:biopolymer transporter ExbD [Aquisalimonas sp.]
MMSLGLRRREGEDGVDVDASVLPLINIVFLLLIFVMLAGGMAAIEPLNVEPPRSGSDERMGETGVQIVVAADGRMVLDGELLPQEALIEQLGERIAASPELTVWLKADAGADSRRVVLFMERLRAAGVEHLQLVTVGQS